ncbi:MAG TPA: POTRA domain-containing protein [Vicinamibacterales bacterium]|nr:POTRA domain-containing protein [Vicinamibacterales bacterium]
MLRRPIGIVGVCLAICAPSVAAQDPQPEQPPPPVVQTIAIAGTKEISESTIRAELRLREGDPLPAPADEIGRRLEDLYRRQDYSFARVTTTFDASTGALAITVDEGVIGGVEFEGVDEHLARSFAQEFALRAGDVFNRKRARQALDVLLEQTRGAVRPARLYSRHATPPDDLSRRRSTFDLVDRAGERMLLVGLREPLGRFHLLPDFGEREDWFSPVDGFAPSLGMGIAVFDHTSFNHTFIAGHVSYKFASERAGYSLGLERPLFGRPKVILGAELYDLTATDDQWQVSSFEQSLAAFAIRSSFRDYYRRRGSQVNAAVRVHPQIEALITWRSEQQDPLVTRTDFSLWNSDELFPPNRLAAPGRLNALIVGASASSSRFDRESLESSYQRHQLEEPFGQRLSRLDSGRDPQPIWRVDWSSEISDASAFSSDFDFQRHIVTGRVRMAAGEFQTVGARAIGGWSGGVLPPQRLFSVGGIGSVHGYEFKAESGNSMALLNLEYEVGWRRGLRGVAFFDTGRASPTGIDAPWLKGVGWGIAVDDIRVDFGYRLDDVPSSLQVLFRFSRTF